MQLGMYNQKSSPNQLYNKDLNPVKKSYKLKPPSTELTDSIVQRVRHRSQKRPQMNAVSQS